ncbi:MAG: aminoacyl-tRNA hydrolase [Clostridia bacterium]|nr:aminoacyl-tRNA hydrolase [Clostridia bacterium]MBR3817523.1 aminoacyl-tRNA hydrolase [Clostridia bacterium]
MNLFSRNRTPSGPPEFIIVGLGNPGKKYELTRHNAGFLFADLLADKNNEKISKIQFKSVTANITLGGHRCLLMKPQTFMNNSGEAVKQAAAFYKIPPENIIVVFDDISLPCGKMRIRRKGSDGGHNGIKSIIYLLNSDKFPRVKLGVGEKPHPEYDLADWVLSSFKKPELDSLREAAENACKAVEMMVQGNIDGAMSSFNS